MGSSSCSEGALPLVRLRAMGTGQLGSSEQDRGSLGLAAPSHCCLGTGCGDRREVDPANAASCLARLMPGAALGSDALPQG